MDLIRHVDIHGLKKDLIEEGCSVPDDFPIHLERYLRVLIHRYRPVKRQWNHTSLKTVPKIIRSFFSEPRAQWGEWFVAWDDNFIRGWRPALITPNKVGVLDPTVDTILQRVFGKQPDLKVAIPIDKIMAAMPRTKRLRTGNYSNVVISVNNGKAHAERSDKSVHKNDAASMTTGKGYEYLFVFHNTVNVTIVNKHLLLDDGEFFLFSRT